MLPQDIQGRRRSERLKETTNLSTMEKVEIIAKQRALEGTSTSNKFSALPVKEIVNTAADMGISVSHDDFATFDLLKTLELARGDLHAKQCSHAEPSVLDNSVANSDSNEPLQLEWLHEKSSDVEDFILVESRKKRRENKKSVKISPPKAMKSKDQEQPGMLKKRGRPRKADILKSDKEKKKK